MKSIKQSGAIEYVMQSQDDIDMLTAIKNCKKNHAGKKIDQLNANDVKELVFAIAKHLKLI